MEILTVAELSAYLNTSTSTIRRLIKKRGLPYFKVGGIIKFNKKTIDEWVKQQEVYNNLQGGNKIENKNIQ